MKKTWEIHMDLTESDRSESGFNVSTTWTRSNLINNRHTFSIITRIPKRAPHLIPSETSGGKSLHPTNCVGVQLALNFLLL